MNDDGLCGSVLISKRFVLTAAHCVGAADEFEIGITDIDQGGYRYAWERKRVHPRYNDVTLENDVAVYELKEDVREDLPFIRLGRSKVTPGTALTVVGFGNTESADDDDDDDDDDDSDDDLPDTNVLLSLDVPYVPTPQCKEDFDEGDDEGDDNFVSPDMLCAGGEFGRGFCNGDSGGPLVAKGESPSEDVLVGIVSWSYDCAGDEPGGYARISYHYDWIVRTMCSMNPESVPPYVDCDGIPVDDLDDDLLESGTQNPTATSSSGDSFDSSGSSSSLSSGETFLQTGTQNPSASSTSSSSSSTSSSASDDDDAFVRAWISDPFGA
jgi:secreted trypsin-like serine protease